jgi:16S rRNA (guanine527-N7)-methyltransferase
MTTAEPGGWHGDLARAVAPWEISISPEAIEAFQVYMDELQKWSPRASLTSLRDCREIALGHFADSLAALLVSEIFSLKEGRAIDVGTGAGFPGLPLRILRPGWSLCLLEATRKKSDFLRAVIAALELRSVEVMRARSEEAAHERDYREGFDLAFSRALAGFPVVLELCLPFLKVGGYLVAHRGQRGPEEAREASRALGELGGEIKEVQRYQIKGLEGVRTLICVRKMSRAHERYPRRVGIPSKRPL